jgi:sugar phosphate isomerase/epimerase
MRIGMTSLGMGSDPLPVVLEAAQGFGCEVMELNGRPTVHQGLWQGNVDYDGVMASIREAGIEVTSLGGYCDLAVLTEEGLEEQVNQLVGYCELAVRLGIPVVRAFVGDVKEGHTADEFYPWVVRGFSEVCQRIAGWDLVIGIENHGRLMNDGDVLGRILADVGSPRLGITLDTGNFCWGGRTIADAHRYFDALLPHIVNVHVKDVRMENGEAVFVPAGRGEIRLAALLQALADRGYEGAVVSEFEGKAAYAPSTQESIAYLRGLRDGILA